MLLVAIPMHFGFFNVAISTNDPEILEFQHGGKSIDHKLPRSQYPWLSMEFENLWVICRDCNIEKAEMHWYRYEQHILLTYPDRYENTRRARPIALLKSLANSLINKSET